MELQRDEKTRASSERLVTPLRKESQLYEINCRGTHAGMSKNAITRSRSPLRRQRRSRSESSSAGDTTDLRDISPAQRDQVRSIVANAQNARKKILLTNKSFTAQK
jgi:hypothetical protein